MESGAEARGVDLQKPRVETRHDCRRGANTRHARSRLFRVQRALCSNGAFVRLAGAHGHWTRFSGNSFGGHAWVEVWVGKWVELDPTWGTDFVDATHIRDSSNALVTSAALNLIDMEVLEAKRNVAEFQKSAKALAQHLSKAIPTAARSDIEATIDLPVLTDEFMGQGAWSKMNDGEKEQDVVGLSQGD